MHVGFGTQDLLFIPSGHIEPSDGQMHWHAFAMHVLEALPVVSAHLVPHLPQFAASALMSRQP